MGLRRTARELALQCLYQIDQGGDPESDIAAMRRNFEVNRKAADFAQELVSGVRKNFAEINSLIVEHAVNWRLERMLVVDRNILRIAVYELAFCTDVPPSVVINEAIEIAKKFSSTDSASFINGILDSVRKKITSKSILNAKSQ